MRFVYCYSMKDDSDAVREVAPKHAAYWHELGVAEYIGGPFADRSGRLISFEAPAEGPAGRIVSNDPSQHAGLINDWWLKIWMPQ
jgi:uncharacterized protein YciI